MPTNTGLMGLLLMQAMHRTKEMEQLPTAAKPSNKLQPLVKQNALTKQKILLYIQYTISSYYRIGTQCRDNQATAAA